MKQEIRDALLGTVLLPAVLAVSIVGAPVLLVWSAMTMGKVKGWKRNGW